MRDWREEAEALPDWLQESTEADGEWADTPVKGIELRPATPPTPEREAPRRQKSTGFAAILVIAILAGLLCLAGGILFAVLVSRAQGCRRMAWWLCRHRTGGSPRASGCEVGILCRSSTWMARGVCGVDLPVNEIRLVQKDLRGSTCPWDCR